MTETLCMGLLAFLTVNNVGVEVLLCKQSGLGLAKFPQLRSLFLILSDFSSPLEEDEGEDDDEDEKHTNSGTYYDW